MKECDIQMSKVSLSQRQSFANVSQYDSPGDLSLALSPSGKLLALLGSTSLTIFDTKTRVQTHRLPLNATTALFDSTDAFLYLTDSCSIRRVSISDGRAEEVVKADGGCRKISSMAYSPDFRLIYFTSRSRVAAYSPLLSTVDFSVTPESALCPADAIFIDAGSEVLVTSSYDCMLCAFSLSARTFTLVANNSIPQCRIGSIAFANGYAFLTQDSITTQTPQIITLSLQKLTIISYLNQSSSSYSLNVANLRNYILSYGRGDGFIWVYKDSLTGKLNQVSVASNVVTMATGRQSSDLYLLVANESDSSISLKTYGLAFNCSAIQNTANSSLSYSESCECKEGMLFDASDLACSKMECLNTNDSPCMCPRQQVFDTFSLSCQLDCSQVYNTYTPASFGTPARCCCNHPFEWNPQLSDCSYVDCSLLTGTVSADLGQRCECESGLAWNDSSVSCRRNDSSAAIAASSAGSTPVGLIIGIVIVVLAVIVSAVIFYVKKYQKSDEDLPKTYQYQPKYEVHSPTPRPFSCENFARADYELAEKPQSGGELGEELQAS